MAGSAVGMEVASDHDTRGRRERFHLRLDAWGRWEVKEVKEVEEVKESMQPQTSYDEQTVKALSAEILRLSSVGWPQDDILWVVLVVSRLAECGGGRQG
jgi:alpha-L-arabinofuranosidase